MQWVLSPKYFKFPFPITLTMIHMAFSGIVTFFLVRVFKVGISATFSFSLMMFLFQPSDCKLLFQVTIAIVKEHTWIIL